MEKKENYSTSAYQQRPTLPSTKRLILNLYKLLNLTLLIFGKHFVIVHEEASVEEISK